MLFSIVEDKNATLVYQMGWSYGGDTVEAKGFSVKTVWICIIEQE